MIIIKKMNNREIQLTGVRRLHGKSSFTKSAMLSSGSKELTQHYNRIYLMYKSRPKYVTFKVVSEQEFEDLL